MNVNELYVAESRPNWAGGTYKSSILESRAFDYPVTNNRSHGRDIEFSLPRALA